MVPKEEKVKLSPLLRAGGVLQPASPFFQRFKEKFNKFSANFFKLFHKKYLDLDPARIQENIC